MKRCVKVFGIHRKISIEVTYLLDRICPKFYIHTISKVENRFSSLYIALFCFSSRTGILFFVFTNKLPLWHRRPCLCLCPCLPSTWL